MTLEDRLVSLERKSTQWRTLCGIQLLAILGFSIALIARPNAVVQADDGILRARGLLLTDASGKARVLLGAPFPQAKDRVRQDAGTASLVFLDEQGHDRLTIGENPPAQINGVVPPRFQRLGVGAVSYGMLLHDPLGNERGGMGFNSTGRASIALDRPNGDAWGAFVDDKTGFAGTLSVYDRNIGDGASGILSGTQGKRAFLTIKGIDDMPRAELAVGPNQKPVLTIFNEQGKGGRDLLEGLLPSNPEVGCMHSTKD